MKPMISNNPLGQMFDNSLNSLPSPMNISYTWNFGFLLSMSLIIQMITGIILAMHYTSDVSTAFSSVDHILRDINQGWLIRIIHSNSASMFFLCIFIHIARGIYYESFKLIETWNVGVIIFLMSMATAFFGYVLPWGQMSFWGATVITNLFSVIPGIGTSVVQWLWGGFSVSSATLTRFFCFHFLLPFILLTMVMIHLMFLHLTGSTNPMGLNSNYYKITFHPYFSTKDFSSMMILMMLLTFLTSFEPWALADPENFIPANSLVTPTHIQPEWYFLFAYAILRSIPNKGGGVVALLMSVLVLFFIPFMEKKLMKGLTFYPLNKILFWIFISSFLILTWIGARPVDGNFIIIGQVFSLLFFVSILSNSILSSLWEFSMKKS